MYFLFILYIAFYIICFLLQFSSSIPYLHLSFLKFTCNLSHHVWKQCPPLPPPGSLLSAFYFPIHVKRRTFFWILPWCWTVKLLTTDASAREITKLLAWSWHQILVKYFESNSSAIRQKSESQNGCYKKTKHAKFSEKTNISYPLIRG